ncbi:asparagine synthase (glutamine-hydrolyzing) [Kiritimatiellota bacterium B12222]|nr:asparagine synthase (glutamine-hydrolyzing) [Kiritimatiellota bacterium B12222]
MCGICGFTWQDDSLIQQMTDRLAHRGPNQHGSYTQTGVSLGHRRLSIIDLTEMGRQPIFNEDGNVAVVFNGEIYNFAALREELEKKGHIFKGHSDSETIVHAFEEYGRDCVNHFQGMFSFAAWDKTKDELFIARDRIGIKPLYYSVVDGQLIFASEIKSILECPKVQRRLDRQALYHYLGHEFVPGPMTMFEGIHKLPPGHFLTWKKGELNTECWWDLEYPDPSPITDPREAVEQVQHLLEDAVKDRLVSDVPLGAFLSGGLDSSAIVAMMRKHITGPLRTYTIGYEDKSFSELDYAKTVSDQFGTESHVLMVNEMTPELIEKSIWHLDEPMTDLSSIPLMLLCEKAKLDVSVILSGEGGDEIFAGYDRFKASKLNRYYSGIPRVIREKMIAPLLMSMPDQPQKKGAINMLKRFVEGSLLPGEAEQIRWQFFLSAELENHLFSDSFRKDVTFDRFAPLRACRERCHTSDRVNAELYLDTRFVMVDSVLMKVDKMSMASALEIRVPFLDHRLVEGIARMPGNMKLKGMETKSIFRKALEGYLPEHIVYRGKQGYSLPVKHLLRNELRGYMTETLMDSPVIRENMNLNYVETLIQEHVDQKHNHNHVLWGLLNTAIWHRRFFE